MGARWTYPLRWPAGRPRTINRQPSNFGKRGDKGWKQNLVFADGKKRLFEQLSALGADEVEITLNLKFRLDGKRDMNISRTDPYDTGVAVYFELNGQKVELACDKWDKIADNMAAIAAHIDALRGQERWGVGDIKTAFSGHIALPAPMQRRHWTDVLDIPAFSTRLQINDGWRAKIKEAKTESEQMDINIARDEALEDRGY